MATFEINRKHDISSVMVIGSGPIVIGQGCEFDYSGTQAVRALRAEGLRVVLINSNPATIMTDPETADATYIEPLNVASCERIIAAERPDALLPTLGGQTALNLAIELAEAGVLEKYGVKLIGVDLDAIQRAEDRSQFKELCESLGLDTPRSMIAHSLDEARAAIDELGLPMIVRPSFTLGGSGSGMARTRDDFNTIVHTGLRKSPVTEVLLEESVEGWKEFELEVMRDQYGNNVVVCAIENLDPMGTHTGDSITVAPTQTLRDTEYQQMRDAAFRIMDAIGVCGGSNVQFGQDPKTGRMVVIEMNPRVSRSSALASKATGYPIAKVAAKLALGYALHELPNDVVGDIPASFEPTLDYVVVKIPRWNFEKFSGVRDELGSQMQSIGEVMALGRTFNEALQKAYRSLEEDWSGLDVIAAGDELEELVRRSNSRRLPAIKAAFQAGWSLERVHELSMIDPWFLSNIQALAELEAIMAQSEFPCHRDLLRTAKRHGFSDRQLAKIWDTSEFAVFTQRERMGINPVVKMVDTCAGEFAARTPYYYVVYDETCDAKDDTPRGKGRVMVLGSGPNRIGQGIEFDYCCVHAAMALRDMGYETIMVNCNPETVSTDFDISDRLYFEPVSFEHVMAIVATERPIGVVCQFGGQTPLKLLHRLAEAGVRILGTSVESVDRAEDRQRCKTLLDGLGIKHPPCSFATTAEQARDRVGQLGYPVLLRPPYVLGGRSMELVYNEADLEASIDAALKTSGRGELLIDKFIEGALEVDVDAVRDGNKTVIASVMEHIEEAGIHSGDSSCVTPPISLEEEIVERIRETSMAIAKELDVLGLINIQYAVKDNQLYCIEVNPRASRTVPYASKTTGVQWVKLAMRAVMGEALPLNDTPAVGHIAVKAPVMPFDRFPSVDSILGPEMRSTGEVMGIGATFDEAFIKAQLGAGQDINPGTYVFVSVANRFKRKVLLAAKALHEMGYRIVATDGMARVLATHGIPSTTVKKISSGDRSIIEMIEDGAISLVVNMAVNRKSIDDDRAIRLAANRMKVPSITTLSGFHALVFGLMSMNSGDMSVRSLQDYLGIGGAQDHAADSA